MGSYLKSPIKTGPIKVNTGLGAGGGALITTPPKPVTVGGGSSGTATSAGPGGTSGQGKDALGNIDYSALWNERVNSDNVSLAELEQIAKNRADKASGGGAYGGYYMDDKQREMYAYLDGLRSQQQPQNQFQFGSLDELKDALGYNEQSAAEQAAIDAYIKQTVNGLESQKQGVTQSADEAARQAYISYMQSQSALPQALAAAGYSGGMADSQKLALETGLQNNQREIGLNRDNTLSGIDSAIINAQLEGSIQGAQAQADLGRDAISAFQQYMQQQNAYANQNFWTKYGYDFQAAQDQRNQQWQSGENQANRDWQTGESQLDRDQTQTTQGQKFQQQKAWDMIQAGLLPGDDMLIAADIEKEYAQAMSQFYAAKLAENKKNYSGGTGDVNATTPDMPQDGNVSQESYNEAAKRFMAGDYSADVVNALLDWDTPDDLAATAGFVKNPYDLASMFGLLENPGGIPQSIVNGKIVPIDLGGTTYYRIADKTMDGDGYRSVLNQLSRVEDMGKSDAEKAGQWVDIIQQGYESGKISESEAKQLLSQYGLG